MLEFKGVPGVVQGSGGTVCFRRGAGLAWVIFFKTEKRQEKSEYTSYRLHISVAMKEGKEGILPGTAGKNDG